ncbi:hypothetical protein GCM10008959_25350 [Deinococcus seoulensis]|uniref:Uncharacterized protein n=1 Tax=Deinococcus seoulensis TaxID=1837379 RepID=A0ABQ2RUB3_9DEIO|nr:hypothetical protein [Deinococcus seoulensis]GGR62313.1 hypothetical protein GCM10008959_25350 [Deinococcus seoulensis]
MPHDPAPAAQAAGHAPDATGPATLTPTLPLAADLRAIVDQGNSDTLQQLDTLTQGLQRAAQKGLSEYFHAGDFHPGVEGDLRTAGYRLTHVPSRNQREPSGWWIRW